MSKNCVLGGRNDGFKLYSCKMYAFFCLNGPTYISQHSVKMEIKYRFLVMGGGRGDFQQLIKFILLTPSLSCSTSKIEKIKLCVLPRELIGT